MIRLSDAQFDRAVEDALSRIPAEFQPYLENVLIEVVPRPTAELMRAYDVPEETYAEAGGLLGLYVGVPLDDKGILNPLPVLPDRILIFRENLCQMCESMDDLIEEIGITVLHEIGHHFGLDEDRLEELGYG